MAPVTRSQITVHASNHRHFKRSSPPEERRLQTRKIMNDLWESLAEKNVLVAPGWFFQGSGKREGAPEEQQGSLGGGQPVADVEKEEEEEVQALDFTREDEEKGLGHFRIAYSFSSHDTLRKGIELFCETVTEFFED